jgi:hypothetical protein
MAGDRQAWVLESPRAVVVHRRERGSGAPELRSALGRSVSYKILRPHAQLPQAQLPLRPSCS